MNALVTGATGFIGSVLARELIDQGHEVRALALPGESAKELERLGIDIRKGDLTNPESLRGICDGMDVVFHLAGRVTDWGKKDLFSRAILDATRNLLEEALGKARRFIYISSIAAIGLGRHMKGIRETDPVFKSGIPYNDAKLDAELLVWTYHDTGRIACTVIRPANVTGPGSVWVRDILDKMRSMPLPLIDGGRYSSSFIYVDNLVGGIVLAGTRDVARGKTYHLRDDWDVTWRRYITDLGAIIGKRPMGSVPYPVARLVGRACDAICTPLGIRPPLTRMAVDITGRDLDVDNTLAKGDLGWKTRITYQEALQRIGVWVMDRYLKGM
ncbi:MAG TPA: NAD-dependent epimerase/dehydratase family protein [Deltaproteobacteria bacterium]|nr:NAD-dependent epimerase/dehydratase family protein [Deltaproteobacteria bacterium]HRW80650.1 NAD-dependent epimerase/dehydratase family protein [Desulfomonilia bacterium]HNQ85381.1 NAD-dependent epimerase/dehydratase family protein [Deltaproteobacteria bacterium]HNS89636.1 NAD-dependent epimerase/dehydratase family protein [Deltaproteobacteria bacterium]HOA44682.1 NAD-dependent epimerase/dehydratase family protein [Deltaproteobacteria bacterium]